MVAKVRIGDGWHRFSLLIKTENPQVSVRQLFDWIVHIIFYRVGGNERLSKSDDRTVREKARIFFINT